MNEVETVKAFFSIIAPGFALEGELPAVVIEAIEVRKDGHAIARVEVDDGRVLPVRFTFDEGRIARVEVL
jgi:hypothetical protein